MSNSLVLGKDDTSGKPFQISPKSVQAHTCIVGKSGCGKTTLVARYVEEVVLRDAGNVLLLDYNHEFSAFSQVSAGAFDGKKGKGVSALCPEDERSAFEAAWGNKQNAISSIPAEQMRVPFSEMSPAELAYLVGVDSYRDPGAFWMVRLLIEEYGHRKTFKDWSGLGRRVRTFERWSEGRRKATEYDIAETAHVMESLTTRLDHSRLRNGVAGSAGGKFLAFADDAAPGAVLLNRGFFSTLLGDRRFTALDLLNFSYDEANARGFIILHGLRLLWDSAKERFRRAKAAGKEIGPPLFVIIDEAHNLVRAGENNPIIELVETIAAEGRKFGVFLVLMTQRPDKINERVVSECENFVTMRSTPGVAQFMRKKLSVGGDKEFDESVRSLAVGQAIFYGRFTDDEMRQVSVGFRRTQ